MGEVRVDEIQQSVEVWRPPTDRPADFDPAVQLRLTAYAKQRPGAIGSVVLYMLVALLWFLITDGISVMGIVLLLLAGWAVNGLVVNHMKYGRWAPSQQLLVRDVPAQRAPARVVSWNGEVAVLRSGEMHLQVRNVNWAVRQIIARTGEISLVGPDGNGTAAVFVDSLPAPVPAQVVAGTAPVEPEPLAVTSMIAAADELPLWFGRHFARLQWIVVAVTVIIAAAFFIDVNRPSADPTATVVFDICVAALLLKGLYRLVDLLRLPALLKTGRWQGYPVSVRAWRHGPRLAGDLGLVLTLPSGEQLPVTVRSATDALVANINATGTLWVVGEPQAGKLTAVGVPGYPIAASARFVETRRLHDNL
jgi:hypothetical protein